MDSSTRTFTRKQLLARRTQLTALLDQVRAMPTEGDILDELADIRFLLGEKPAP